MRGVSGLLLLLLLALLAAASLLALVAVEAPPPPPPGEAPGGGGRCRAGPVTVEARVGGGVLEVSLQPPNPCYKLRGLRGFVEGVGGGVAVVRVEGVLEEPGEGVVCPQVLPPPERVVVGLPEGVAAVELEVVLHGARGVYACGLLVGAGGEG